MTRSAEQFRADPSPLRPPSQAGRRVVARSGASLDAPFLDATHLGVLHRSRGPDMSVPKF